MDLVTSSPALIILTYTAPKREPSRPARTSFPRNASLADVLTVTWRYQAPLQSWAGLQSFLRLAFATSRGAMQRGSHRTHHARMSQELTKPSVLSSRDDGTVDVGFADRSVIHVFLVGKYSVCVWQSYKTPLLVVRYRGFTHRTCRNKHKNLGNILYRRARYRLAPSGLELFVPASFRTTQDSLATQHHLGTSHEMGWRRTRQLCSSARLLSRVSFSTRSPLKWLSSCDQ